MAFVWTETNTQHLRDMWSKGLTAAKIAVALGNPSRNSVIGRAARIGLPGRPSPITHRPDGERRVPPVSRPYQPRPPKAAKPVPTLPLVIMPRRRQAPVVENPGLVQFGALLPGQCKWIPGPTIPGRADQAMACGEAVADVGLPWCAAHKDRAKGKPAKETPGLEAPNNWAVSARRVA